MREGLDAAGMPEPSAEALEHSRRLEAFIAEAIRGAGGAIRFAEYMRLALYAPGLGYYSAGARKFGPAGDFTTAPEVSSLFSACIARSCGEVLDSIDGGEIVEIGAGSGQMTLDVLLTLESAGRLPERYRILEVSADLRDRQRRLLSAGMPGFVDRIRWIDDMPSAVNGTIVANEVLDALPFERFRAGSPDPEYLGVGRGEHGFRVVPMPADEALKAQVRRIDRSLGTPIAPGYVSEWRPGLKPFVSSLARSLRKGALLLIDYGLPRRELYHPDRSQGTMMCHYRHRAHGDPFLNPGLQDITAWVDFTAVAEAATDVGLVLDGFTTQAHYLIGSGIVDTAALGAGSARRQLETASALRTLTLPGEMGERFKVIGFSRHWSGVLPGLTGKDLSGSL